jgi:hypothetical protein
MCGAVVSSRRDTVLGYSQVVQILSLPTSVLVWCCWVVDSAHFPWANLTESWLVLYAVTQTSSAANSQI